MNINQSFPSKYLRADGDIPDDEDLIVTIENCQMEEIGQGSDTDHKPVLYFREVDKGLVLNRTNANTISGVLGTPDTDEWVGKNIALFSTEVDFAGKQTLAIRVRMKRPKTVSREPVAAQPAKAVSNDNDPFAEDD